MNTIITQPIEFDGIERLAEAESILQESLTQTVIVYAPPFFGKTFMMRYLSNHYKPSILLEVQPQLEDTLNVFKFTQRLGVNQFNEFLGAIEEALKNHSKPLLIIDGFEKIADIEKKRFLQIFKG